MHFQDFPWLVASLFMRGGFDRSDGPGEAPIGGRSIIALLAALGLLIVVAVWRVDC
jgi:hypothetical protein